MVLEDWRLVTIATATGWYTVVLYDDGAELVESVNVTPQGYHQT